MIEDLSQKEIEEKQSLKQNIRKDVISLILNNSNVNPMLNFEANTVSDIVMLAEQITRFITRDSND